MAAIERTFTAPPRWQTDPSRVRALAVLTGWRNLTYHTSLIGGTILADEEIVGESDTLADWAFIWLLDKCASAWIVPPHARDWQAEMRAFLANPPAFLDVHPLSSDGQLAGVIVQRSSGGALLGIYLLDAGDPWGIAGRLADLEPFDLADGLARASQRLGMQLRFSPSYVGLQMLRQELARKPYPIPPLSERVYRLSRATPPTYIQWSRPITPRLLRAADRDGTGAVTIYKYDRNGSFVASAGEVPVGEPIQTHTYHKGQIGIYWLDFLAPRTWDFDLPGPFHLGKGAGIYPAAGVTWAWEPQIRLALCHGWDLHIRDGWIWPRKQRHDLFRTWRERIWVARQNLERGDSPADGVARKLVKRVGVATIGRINQKRARAIMAEEQAAAEDREITHREVDEQGEMTGLAEVVAEFGKTDLIRPDWWGTIIANANERLMAALYGRLAALPVAAYVDAVYCLLPWPAEDLHPETLGKWKLERAMRVSDAEIGELNQLGAAGWVKRLAAIARAEGVPGWEMESEADDGEATE